MQIIRFSEQRIFKGNYEIKSKLMVACLSKYFVTDLDLYDNVNIKIFY